MNRSFRAPERGMQPAMAKQRQQMKEKEEELALFLEMRKREKERINLLSHNSDEFDAPLGLTTGSSPIFDIASATPAPVRKTAADEFLNSENDKNDYEWLLTPPGTPLFPSLEMESQKTIMSETGSPKARPTALRSRLANPQLEPIARTNLALRQSASSPGLRNSNGSNGIVHRPSSSGGPGSRPATPTGCPTLTSSSKPTLNSASKPMLTTAHKSSSYTASKPSSPAASKPSSPAVSKPSSTTASKPSYTSASKSSSTIASRPSRSSTPTSHATLTTTKATVPARSSTPTPRSTPRSSTPTSRSNARASTPTARASVPASKPTSTRATTPIRRPTTTLSNAPNLSAPPVKSPSASVPKVTPATARNPAPLRASSPTVKSRPWKPSEMPGFSLDAPPNLRTSLSDRPTSASRGRPGAPSIRSASVEPAPNGRIRRQSCSPSRGRPPNGFNINSGGSVPALNRAYAKVTDNVSPVMYGTKMVERVINMRKLVPPRQDDKHSPLSNLSGKSSSPDSSGFGRTLSKKSLDMAIRHMDIRRSIPGNLRPLMTNIPASSMYSVRSGPPPRGRVVNVSDSPLATSSNASSEVSVNNNSLCLDRIELEDDTNTERGVQSPANVRADEDWCPS